VSRGNSTLDRRQLLRLFGAVAAVGATSSLAAACGADLPDDTIQRSGLTIRVGLVVPSSGPLARIGADIERGFRLFLDANSGLLGPHYVDVRVADEGETPESALAAVQELLGQRVVAIVGVTNPEALPAIALEMQNQQVPLVTPHTAPGTLTNALFVWRVGAILGDGGRALAGYAIGRGSRAYLLWDGTLSGNEEADTFVTAFSDLGGQVVNDPRDPNSRAQFRTPGAENLANRLAEAGSLDADTIFAAFSGPDALAVLEAYRVSGLDIPLLGTASLTETIDLAALGPTLPQNVYTSMFYAPDLDNDANRRFVTEYHRAHGTQPTGYAMAAYDGAAVLSRALGLVPGDPTGAQINTEFSSLGQIDSPRGTWTFNINRSPQQKWYLRQLGYDGMVPSNLLDSGLTVLG
jgi:branched-chain amino acid transport system substrate-binding protein